MEVIAALAAALESVGTIATENIGPALDQAAMAPDEQKVAKVWYSQVGGWSQCNHSTGAYQCLRRSTRR